MAIRVWVVNQVICRSEREDFIEMISSPGHFNPEEFSLAVADVALRHFASTPPRFL